MHLTSHEIRRNKLISYLIIGGKKITATRIVEEALEILYKRVAAESNNQSKFLPTKLELFSQALKQGRPWLSVTSTKRGGKKVLIPQVIPEKNQDRYAMQFLVKNTKDTKNNDRRSAGDRLANELYGCLTNQGKTIQDRDHLHQLAESNRAQLGGSM